LPVEYSIDAVRRLVSTTVTGVVSVADMHAYYQALAVDPAFDPAFDSIIDFTEAAAFAASGAEVRELARSVPSTAGARRALVVNTELHYGFGRMASLTRTADLEIRVFRSRAEALQWLGKHEDAPA
jgi:hypothetical protein